MYIFIAKGKKKVKVVRVKVGKEKVVVVVVVERMTMKIASQFPGFPTSVTRRRWSQGRCFSPTA